jgi:Cof subfamily protein (haloacid dehalogenase superfamily)
MNQYKLLAMDLDGTAVNDAGNLTEKTKASFLRAKEIGCLICFVSGRRDVDMITLKDDMQDVDYIILNNGGKIIDWQQRTTLENVRVDKDVAGELVRYCLKKTYILHVMGDRDNYWGTNILSPRTENYCRQIGVSPMKYSSFDDVPSGIEGFVAFQDGANILQYISDRKLPLWGVESEPGCYDIMPENVTKFNGILRLTEHLHIGIEKVITAGNYYNDIEMIEKAGLGVAVANALEPVKEAADYVTKHDNNNDAMAEIIDRFICQ